MYSCPAFLKYALLGMALIFYSSLARGLKLKARKIWKAISTFEEVTGEN